MRSIVLVDVESKLRPALVLTPTVKREHAGRITVAPISTVVRGSATEVAVGRREGLDRPSVVKCENIQTVPASDLVREIGLLASDRERELRVAVVLALDLLPLAIA